MTPGQAVLENPRLCLSELTSQFVVLLFQIDKKFSVAEAVATSPEECSFVNSSTLVVVFSYKHALHSSWTQDAALNPDGW